MSKKAIKEVSQRQSDLVNASVSEIIRSMENNDKPWLNVYQFIFLQWSISMGLGALALWGALEIDPLAGFGLFVLKCLLYCFAIAVAIWATFHSLVFLGSTWE